MANRRSSNSNWCSYQAATGKSELVRSAWRVVALLVSVVIVVGDVAITEQCVAASKW